MFKYDLEKLGSAVFIPCPFSIGDDFNPTTFNDNGAAIISPASNATNQENFRLTDDAMRVYLNTRDNNADTVVLSGAYSWGSAAEWDFNISNASTCLLSGSFIGMGNFKLGSSVTATGTFSLADFSKAVESTGADINGITVVEGSLNIKTDLVTTFTNITASTVNLDTAGIYRFVNCTINEINTSDYNSVTTVILDNTEISGYGFNIVVEYPPRTLTLTGLQPGSEVRVYESGTINEIAGVEDSNETFLDNTISVDLVDIVVHSITFEHLRIEGADTTSNLTLPIQQRFDRGYDND